MFMRSWFQVPRLLAGLTLAVLLLAAASPATAQPTLFFFKDGDRIVVMGDSITEQHLYSNYLEMWTVTRFPKWNLTFRNVGIGGDTSGGGNGRFKRDVLAHNATALTVDFGMNDGGYAPFDEKRFANYMKGLQGIANQAKEAKVRVAWITPQPCEGGPEDKGYNATLEKFSEGVQEIAKKNDGLFVDQFHPYYAVIKKAREKDAKVRVMAGDAVHPGPPGQAVMAASILKGMSFPTAVSAVTVHLNPEKGGKAVKDTTVTGCSAKATFESGVLTIVRKDNALPWFPAEARSILKWTPLLEDMNDYRLRLENLPAGDWEVEIGGKKAAKYSAEQLRAGVNLADAVISNGPVAENVAKVWSAVKDKNKYFHDQIFRGVLLAGPKSDIFKGVDAKDAKAMAAARSAAYDERMKKMPELDTAVRQALQTAMNAEYTITIRPVKK